MTTVTVADMRACGYCARGAREFARRNGLDWQAFVSGGIDAAELEKLDNSMAEAVVEVARKREQEEQQ